jgi:beta-ureidopropionase / N-carbamoyl-L-amino-acid hydrolase
MYKTPPTLSEHRLFAYVEELGAVGATPEGGVRRLALTDEDKAGRDLLVSWMQEANLTIQVDAIGNIFGTRQGKRDLPPVMTGSHIDTVGNGGKLDGNLGVLAGLEIVQTLNDHHLETTRPITIAIFTNEEGARFQPDMMGSLVHAGGLDIQEALDLRDDRGLRIGDELQRIGYSGDMPPGAIVPHAFIELHIEQGPILEREEVTLGAVEDLQGISWTEVIFEGQSNHAGTTPMRLRHDTSYCAGALAVFVRSLANDLGHGQVATIGVIELQPNIINVVPGRARVTVDLRNADDHVLLEAERRLAGFLDRLANDEGVTATTSRLVRFEPVRFDAGIVALIETHAKANGHSCRRMTSGAGHDAQMMARVCPTAMIFTPSINGISHNPAEATAPADLMAGAEVLFHTVLDLANGEIR